MTKEMLILLLKQYKENKAKLKLKLREKREVIKKNRAIKRGKNINSKNRNK